MLEHHPLTKEFPQYKDTMHSLKVTDNHFHKAMVKYEELDKKIFRIAISEETSSEVALENLKKERLVLKDYILVKLKETEAKVL